MSKLPLGEFLVFNQELLALVKSGLPVLRVWDLLIERAGHPGFQQALREIREAIRGGSSGPMHSLSTQCISRALHRHGESRRAVGQSPRSASALCRVSKVDDRSPPESCEVFIVSHISGDDRHRRNCISIELCHADLCVGLGGLRQDIAMGYAGVA